MKIIKIMVVNTSRMWKEIQSYSMLHLNLNGERLKETTTLKMTRLYQENNVWYEKEEWLKWQLCKDRDTQRQM